MARSFWQRVGSLFTSHTADVGGYGSTAVLEPADRTVTAPPTVQPEGAGGPTADPPPTALAWWRRRQERQNQTREMAVRLVALADAMQEHFRRQDERAAGMTRALERVGGILEQLAETQRAHGECLRAIAEHAATTQRQTANLSETLARIPDSLLTQAEAIRTVAVQLDVAQETDTQLHHTLQQFSRAVDALGASGAAQARVLEGLSAAQQHQHEAVATLVHDLRRRWWIAAAILVVVGAALGAAVLFGIPRLTA